VRSSWPVLGVGTRAFGPITGLPAVPEPKEKKLLLGLLDVVKTKENFGIKIPHSGEIAVLTLCRK
jgi:hypothetical protein